MGEPSVFMRDDASHWYLIPVAKATRFSELMEIVCGSIGNAVYDACEEAENEFAQYRIDGGISRIVVIPTGEER